jgi:hypothetical protein
MTGSINSRSATISRSIIIIIIIINPFYMLYKSVTIVAWQGSLPAFLLSYLTGDTVYMEVIWLCACEDHW